MEHDRSPALLAAGALLALSLAFAASPAAAQGKPPSSGIDTQRIEQMANEAAQKAAEAAQAALERTQAVQEEAMRQAEAAIAEIEADTASVEFLTSEMGGPREVVKNAPYAAEAVTESTRVLMDGNRIVHKSMTLIARDSAGRTRQETKRDHGSVVYIYDPVEQRSYVLRPASKTAVILPRVAHLHTPPAPPAPPAAPAPPAPPAPPARPAAPMAPTPPDSAAVSVQPGRVVVRGGKSGAGDNDVEVEVIRIAGDETTRRPPAPMPPMPPMPPLTMGGHPLVLPYVSKDKGITELLGTRDFDGVRADGKRTTRTIPAGAIGNEKVIAIVSERWFSPDLDVVVMTRNLDPRSGETVYRLTNIKRGEPSADLFKIPTDYKVRNEERSERKR